ncbi:MAG TPA: glycosyltransferase family 4 protein [Actinomycetota bacterium]|nr:glycosyltransferase family 4 protein [Actinomycetota bacterium]
MRVALLTYRGSPHSGGQGVYIRYLSRALADIGHEVTVYSGQPYPDLAPGVHLVKVPSLDLYRQDDPFRTPKREEFRDAIDVLEYAGMCVAGFPEPLTFTLRAARLLRQNARHIDIVHDNQSLGYGLLGLRKAGLPVIATIHHPIPLDKRLEVANAPSRKKRMAIRRWYGFTRMQGRVARRLPRLIAPSESARDDSVREFGLPHSRLSVVHNGVDSDLFRPLPEVPRVPGRIITTASADVPLKGLIYLIEAVAKLRTERDVDLVVIGKARPSGPVASAIQRFGLERAVRFETGVDWLRLVELYAQAEVAVVPSLYEGFSLPAAESMACGLPLVATTAGALPEVTGPGGECALLVPPADADALAGAIRTVLENPGMARRLGAAARARVLQRFTWKQAAAQTEREYRKVIASC